MSALLNPRDVAARLNCSSEWVRQNAEALGGIRIGKMWRFHADRIAHVAEHGTIDAPWQEAESPASPSVSAPETVAGGAFVGANTAGAGRSAGTRRSRTRRTPRPSSVSASARDFPEYANG